MVMPMTFSPLSNIILYDTDIIHCNLCIITNKNVRVKNYGMWKYIDSKWILNGGIEKNKYQFKVYIFHPQVLSSTS